MSPLSQDYSNHPESSSPASVIQSQMEMVGGLSRHSVKLMRVQCCPGLRPLNSEMEIKMAADTSAYRVWEPHVYPDGSEEYIAFAPCTLSKSQNNYAQIKKETLALVFGVGRFTDTSTDETSHWSLTINI